MECDLNSPVFGVGVDATLNLGLAMNPVDSMENIVNGDIGVQMSYKTIHEEFSKELIRVAGGEER